MKLSTWVEKKETEMNSTFTIWNITLSSVFKRVCFIRSVKFIYINVNFIRCIQIIIRQYRPFTLVQWEIYVWSSELYPSGLGTIKIKRIRRFWIKENRKKNRKKKKKKRKRTLSTSHTINLPGTQKLPFNTLGQINSNNIITFETI